MVTSVSTANATHVCGTQLDAKRFAERVCRLDDARLDQHLANRHIQLRDHLLNLHQARRNVRDEQLIGTRLGNHGASGTQQALGAAGRTATAAATTRTGELRSNLCRLRVVELEGLGAQGLQIPDGRLRLQFSLLLRRQFVLGRNLQHVAAALHAQILGLQNDVQGLIPGDVLQAQGQIALHGVGRHDVEVREVGDHLQQRPDVDVLEVKRQLFSTVPGPLRQFVGAGFLLPHLDHELVVALIGTVLPQAFRFDHHAHPITRLHGGDGLHGRTEIGNVETATQALRQAGAQELDHQVLPLLANVDTHLVVGQVDDHAAGILDAPAEIDVAQRQCPVVAAFRKHTGGCCRNRSGRGHRRQRHQQRAALHLGLVVGGLVQVEHHAGSVGCLNHMRHAQVALVEFHGVALKLAAHAGEVQRNACR